MQLGRIAALSAGMLVVLLARPQRASTDAATVVARVGPHPITAADVRARLQTMPPYQRRALGSSAGNVRDRVVRDLLAVEWLHAAEADRLGLPEDPAVRARINEALRRSLQQQERDRLQRENPVTDEDARRYYEANRTRFETPRRLRLWRILVDTEQQARQIIAEARGAGGPQRWSRHAREQSRDTATRMRKGDLGFVRRDGRTDVPRVRVDPGLFAAAETVRDGELVPQPVREGKRFAAVWRRGSLPESTRSLEQEAPAIRRILMRARVREAIDALVRELRRRHLGEVNDALLQHVSAPAPRFAPRPRPGAGAGPALSAAPQRGPRGLR